MRLSLLAAAALAQDADPQVADRLEALTAWEGVSGAEVRTVEGVVRVPAFTRPTHVAWVGWSDDWLSDGVTRRSLLLVQEKDGTLDVLDALALDGWGGSITLASEGTQVTAHGRGQTTGTPHGARWDVRSKRFAPVPGTLGDLPPVGIRWTIADQGGLTPPLEATAATLADCGPDTITLGLAQGDAPPAHHCLHPKPGAVVPRKAPDHFGRVPEALRAHPPLVVHLTEGTDPSRVVAGLDLGGPRPTGPTAPLLTDLHHLRWTQDQLLVASDSGHHWVLFQVGR